MVRTPPLRVPKKLAARGSASPGITWDQRSPPPRQKTTHGRPLPAQLRSICDLLWPTRKGTRYPIEDTANRLTGFDESPRVGFQALCALARWLGSRDERVPASACLANAAAGTAAGCRRDAGTDGPATAPKRLVRQGDKR